MAGKALRLSAAGATNGRLQCVRDVNVAADDGGDARPDR